AVIIILRSPSPTLFPYTTLFRSKRLAADLFTEVACDHDRPECGNNGSSDSLDHPEDDERLYRGRYSTEGRTCSKNCKTNEENFRSEEHTSELQSRENLVCRLLLE